MISLLFCFFDFLYYYDFFVIYDGFRGIGGSCVTFLVADLAEGMVLVGTTN
jgi:hypothetical protein